MRGNYLACRAILLADVEQWGLAAKWAGMGGAAVLQAACSLTHRIFFRRSGVTTLQYWTRESSPFWILALMVFYSGELFGIIQRQRCRAARRDRSIGGDRSRRRRAAWHESRHRKRK